MAAKTAEEVTLAPIPGDETNPWIEFFDAMSAVPRDSEWDEFCRIMDERPMNRVLIARHLFVEEE